MDEGLFELIILSSGGLFGGGVPIAEVGVGADSTHPARLL